MHSGSVEGFLLKVLLWLPISFALWYAFASAVTWPIAFFTNAVFVAFFSDTVNAVQQQLYLLVIKVHYNLATLFGLPIPIERLERHVSFTINSLRYTYSLPLFLGMTLASPSTIAQKLKRCALGGLSLVPLQVLCVSFEILYELASRPGPIANARDFSLAPQLLTGLPRTFLAFAYQFGLVIIPAVSPILIWAGMHRDQLKRLTLTVPSSERKTTKLKKKKPSGTL